MERDNDNKSEFTGLTPVRIVVSEEAFAKLQEELDRPAKVNPELVKLFQTDFSHLFS